MTPRFCLTEKAVPQTFLLLECMLLIHREFWDGSSPPILASHSVCPWIGWPASRGRRRLTLTPMSARRKRRRSVKTMREGNIWGNIHSFLHSWLKNINKNCMKKNSDNNSYCNIYQIWKDLFTEPDVAGQYCMIAVLHWNSVAEVPPNLIQPTSSKAEF